MKEIRFMWILFLIALFTLSLSGCDEDDEVGFLTLRITDAPVDEADMVVIRFTGVEIQSASDERLNFDFESAREIDLLALHGGGSELLLDKESLPPGTYNWIRLKVEAEHDKIDSYIEIDGKKYSLWIPSGNQTGLKLVSGFDVTDNGEADFTIDFDLRKSVHKPQGSDDYILKPALRIVDNTEIGSIVGRVDPSLIIKQCGVPIHKMCGGLFFVAGGAAVYIFEGHDVTPDDVDEDGPDPITTTLVKYVNGLYEYKSAFLSPGNYTVTFTCQALADDPKKNDIISFVGTANVTVSAKQETTHNFL